MLDCLLLKCRIIHLRTVVGFVRNCSKDVYKRQHNPRSNLHSKILFCQNTFKYYRCLFQIHPGIVFVSHLSYGRINYRNKCQIHCKNWEFPMNFYRIKRQPVFQKSDLQTFEIPTVFSLFSRITSPLSKQFTRIEILQMLSHVLDVPCKKILRYTHLDVYKRQDYRRPEALPRTLSLSLSNAVMQ